MKWLTLAIIAGVVVIAAVTAVAIFGLGAPATKPTTPTTPPTTPPPTTETPPPTATVTYDEQLAKKGLEYFKTLGCTACHTIKSLKVTGGAVGPDLSKTLFDINSQWIGRYYKEKGLTNPAADPQKAAELLTAYLNAPPQYSTTMAVQVQTYKSLYGEDWEKEYVPALVELFKMAASK